MVRVLSLIYFLLITNFIYAQSFVGAWEAMTTSAEGILIRNVVIFSDGYQVLTQHDAKTGAFISTNGGSWKLDSATMTEVVEFDSSNPDRVGSVVSFEVYLDDNTMGIVGSDLEWKRIDDGTAGALQGAWLFSGRVRNGETLLRDIKQPRKTMKIMSGKRFQWIAYNTATKEFMGTGGGTYSAYDGKYVENLEFFSRDDTRVGASLEFNFELIDGHWHHTGLSSKGKPIHEIWSVRP